VLTSVTATRYVTPMREGGSLPGLMEADDLGTYVVKFTGAGQGTKALVAEVVATALARALGFEVPRLVTVDVDPALAPGEPDQEVQDLLRRSGGRNLGVDFLPGALDFDPVAFEVDRRLAGRVLWFDALVANADRSWRNPNLLYWHGRLVLIDHGATLTFQHRWTGVDDWVRRPYDARDHALVEVGPDVLAADADLATGVTDDVLAQAVAEVPQEWLEGSPAGSRAAFADVLRRRLDGRDEWLPALAASAERRGADREVRRPRTGRPAWLDLPGDTNPGVAS
jgi:hypothetical protein